MKQFTFPWQDLLDTAALRRQIRELDRLHGRVGCFNEIDTCVYLDSSVRERSCPVELECTALA